MKKNLDNLFQEKLTHLHEQPNENVWKSIESSLDKKRKSRRILPIWWTIGGVAALVAILFYVAQPKSTDLNSNSIITDTDHKNKVAPVELNENQNGTLKNNGESITTIDALEKGQKNKENPLLGAPADKDSWTATSTKSQSPSNVDKGGSNNLVVPTKNNGKQETLAATPSFDPIKKLASKEDGTGIAFNNNSKNQDATANEMLETGNNKKPLDTNTLADNTSIVANKELQGAETKSKKKSIYDEINAQKTEEEIVDNNPNKWSLEPSVAPVYFNGFGSDSPIHPEFSSNSKSGNINLSYGVFVSYEVSKKLSLRSGVYKVDYGYDTNDVGFTSSFAATSNSSLANIDYADNATNIIVVSNSKGKPISNIRGEISGKTPAKNGSMIQQLGYLEIPLELNYIILDKEFGIHLIGGFSSLLLTDNAVMLEANGLSTEIGEANNINDVNFSSNIGFGLNYKFTPKIKLNIEPVFKYQLNTFSNSAGDFKPFSIGVYSGFNFKF